MLVGPAVDQPATQKAGFDLLDATHRSAPRARALPGLSLLRLPLTPVGDGSVLPGGILGGDLLRGYSVDVPLRRDLPATA